MVASKQTRLKLRKGFVKAPIVYKVLAADQLNEKDLRYVLDALSRVKTYPDAQKLLEHNVKNKWRVFLGVIGFQTGCAVVTYKGVEVALLYKRQVNIVEPAPEDPAPTGALENPDDVWVMFLLVGASNSKLKKLYAEESKEKSRTVAQLKVEVASLTKIIDAHEHTIRSLQGRLKIKDKK